MRNRTYSSTPNKRLDNQSITFVQKLRSYFKFDSRQAILKKEIIGGISTFLAMCYILAVNPAIVGNSLLDPSVSVQTAAQYTGGLFLATAISSFLGTVVMGLYARVPVALAPGMGLNAFFAYTVASQVGFESALTITILSGILYMIVAVTPARKLITEAIPKNFKIAVGAGIGLFIAYIGLKNAGIVVASGTDTITGIGNFGNPLVILAVVLILLGLILHFAKVPAPIVITMIIGAIVVVILCCSGAVTPHAIVGVDENGAQIIEQLPNYGLLGSYSSFNTFSDVAKAGWMGFANTKMWANPMTYVGVLSFLYVDFFDTTGSLVVIDRIANFEDTDKKWMTKANHVDAAFTFIGAGIGSTTVTSFVESTVGVSFGARTGVASITTGLLFALSIALWPIMNVFLPITLETGISYQPVTAPALVIVGALMISQIKYFEWEIFADIPTMFITIMSMLLFNSIALGISFGMIVYVAINLSLGLIQLIKHKKRVVNDLTMPISDINDKSKTREFNYLKRVNWTCAVIAIIAIIYIVLEQVYVIN